MRERIYKVTGVDIDTAVGIQDVHVHAPHIEDVFIVLKAIYGSTKNGKCRFRVHSIEQTDRFKEHVVRPTTVNELQKSDPHLFSKR